MRTKNMRGGPEGYLPHRPERADVWNFHLRNGNQTAEDLGGNAVQSEIHEAEAKRATTGRSPWRHASFRMELTDLVLADLVLTYLLLTDLVSTNLDLSIHSTPLEALKCTSDERRWDGRKANGRNRKLTVNRDSNQVHRMT